jgi:transcriptional regulator with XRE-family HTH domain
VITAQLGYQELRNRIRTALRDARRAAGLSQQELGERLGLSRFTIMRLEAGTQDLRLDQAREIERETGDSGLVELLEARDRVADSRRGAPARDQGVRNLLERTGIHRVEVSLVDDLRLHEFLGHNFALENADVVVVVPTSQRERELFDGMPLHGHYEHELKRLTDLPDGPASVRIFESHLVLQPALVVRTSTGDECAAWPLLFRDGIVRGADAPIVSSQEPNVVEELARHIATVTADTIAMPVHKNEVLGVLDDEAAPTDDLTRIKFAGYAPHGEENGETEKTNVGLGVSLVVAYGTAPREGLPPKRRVVLYKRENEKRDVGLWSLVSSHVEDGDIRRAIAADDGAEWRSFLSAEEAAVRDGLALEKVDFRIPIKAFQYAAQRELSTMFGLDVEYGRLEVMELPPELAQIDKATDEEPRRRPILPQVFSLELDRSGAGTRELSRLRESGVETAVFGYDDLPSGPAADEGTFNDFLVAAGIDDWLKRELATLGVAPR